MVYESKAHEYKVLCSHFLAMAALNFQRDVQKQLKYIHVRLK